MSGHLAKQLSVLSLNENDNLQIWKGQLRLTIKAGSGVLTIYVLQARYIQSMNVLNKCNTFVQVLIIGKHDPQAYFDVRTRLAFNDGNPAYNDVFSFELTDDIIKRRLEVNVWSTSSSKSPEFLGCMSFGVRSLLFPKTYYSQRVDGWYYLLEHPIGTRKHLPVPKDREALLKKSFSATKLNIKEQFSKSDAILKDHNKIWNFSNSTQFM